jgi:hypothetical protein
MKKERTMRRTPSFRVSKEDYIKMELGHMREQLESQGHGIKPGYFTTMHVGGTVLSVEPLPDNRIKVRVRLEDSLLNHAAAYQINFGGQVVEVTCPYWNFHTWDPEERKKEEKRKREERKKKKDMQA